MSARVLELRRGAAGAIAEERLRMLAGIGGPLAAVTIVGLSVTGHPQIKLEVPLVHADEAAAYVRAFLQRRDRESVR